MIYKPVTGLLFLIVFTIGCLSKKENSDMRVAEKGHHKNIAVIAHRGGAKLAPENTIAAIKNAIRLGVDMIEIDVQQTSDSAVVVIHDDSINRTSSGRGKVKELPLAEIKKYDAGSWFNNEFKNEKIPTLDEVFETLNGKAKLLIEIKDGDEEYPGLEKRVVDLIYKYDAKEWVIVQSFNEKTVLRVKEMDEEIFTYYLLGKNFGKFLKKEKVNFNEGKVVNKKYDGLALHHSVVNKKNIEVIRKMGYGLFVWTVNDIDKMRNMIDLGVDGIITDLPNRLNELLQK